MHLEGKTLVVTGAASGIGRATALEAAQSGARLALLDRNEAGLQETARLLPADQDVLLLPVDVADEQAVDDAMHYVRDRYTLIDAVINYAAVVADWGLPAELPDSLWDEVLAINLKGIVHVCRSALPAMSNRGAFVNTSSICGTARTCKTRAPYEAAKAAIVAFTRDLAVAYGPRGIRANTLVPGFIDTPMSHRLIAGNWERARAEEQRIPLRHIGQAAEVARVALFLASDAASYVTGSVLFVDGGLSLV